MEYDTRRLNDSYALLVAEESPRYEPRDEPRNEPHNEPRDGVDSPSQTPLPRTSTLPSDFVEHGQNLRLATALIEGALHASSDRQAKSDKLRALSSRAAGRPCPPETDEALLQRLQHLVRSNDRNIAEQLSLFLRVDELMLWKKSGCRDCIHWMDLNFGISRVAAFERLRVARAFHSLPVIESLFAVAQLSWSKVRELTRVANSENEQELAAAALELSASETVELCRRWRHGDYSPANTPVNSDEYDNQRALLAYEERSLTWRQRDPYTTRVTLDLPVELAAEFLKAMEAQEDQLREEAAANATSAQPSSKERSAASSDSCSKSTSAELSAASIKRRTATQIRADAALQMSAKALAHSGEPVASADRYRVFVNIDARVLAEDVEHNGRGSDELPIERASIPGYGPIAAATARRLAGQARLSVIATDSEGDVVATGRDTRLFSPGAVRAINARDRCCQMPGCTRTRWLQAHHVIPWSEGGDTTVINGCLICSLCHRRLHEEGLLLERVTSESVGLRNTRTLKLTSKEQRQARRLCARVQRFRLVRADGSVVAGPRRRSAGELERTSSNIAANDTGSMTARGNSRTDGNSPEQFPRGNYEFDVCQSDDGLKRFRIDAE